MFSLFFFSFRSFCRDADGHKVGYDGAGLDVAPGNWGEFRVLSNPLSSKKNPENRGGAICALIVIYKASLCWHNTFSGRDRMRLLENRNKKKKERYAAIQFQRPAQPQMSLPLPLCCI